MRSQSARETGPALRLTSASSNTVQENGALSFDGYTIYVYSPEMLVCEKLRALGQQMPDYCAAGWQAHAPARDFLDIHDTVRKFRIDLTTGANRELLRRIFAAKRVPPALLGKLHEHREFHRQDWRAVEETVRPHVRLQSFDFYFDFVVALIEKLEALGNE